MRASSAAGDGAAGPWQGAHGRVNLALTNLAVLICTSMTLCLALVLSWLYLARRRHVLLWACAAGTTAVQWSIAALSHLAGPRGHVSLMVTGSLVVAASTLLALGCRDRAGLPMRLPLFIGASLLAVTAIVVVLTVHPNLALRGFIANGFGAVLTMVAAGALFPRHRVISAPEMIVFVALMIFGLLEMALSLLSLGMGPSGAEAGAEAYRNLLIIGLPATYAAIGISVVFLLANDLNAQLQRLVSRDPLTGILNRRGLFQAATAALANARRHGRPLTVVIGDLDGFKAFNLRRGYAMGDQMLCAFADLVAANIREEDLFGRIDGNVFALVLIDSSASDALDVVARSRRELAMLHAEDDPAGLTACFGLSASQPEDDDMVTIARRADEALQRARSEGRDHVALG